MSTHLPGLKSHLDSLHYFVFDQIRHQKFKGERFNQLLDDFKYMYTNAGSTVVAFREIAVLNPAY